MNDGLSSGKAYRVSWLGPYTDRLMTVNEAHDDRTTPPSIDDRYQSLTDGQDVVIYDDENEDAWISSSYAVPLGGDR